MEEDSAGTEQSTLSSERRQSNQNETSQQGVDLPKVSSCQEEDASTMSSVTPTPPPPPALPNASLRDHRCPIHSALVRHESGQSGGSNSVVTCSASSSGGGDTNRHRMPTAAARKYVDLKTSTIRQHYYPEGGWGWLICACAFMVHVLTTGMQLSYGVLYSELLVHYGQHYVMQAGWLGALSMSVSLFSAPFVVALCRRKSTRLTAVFGGLSMALACLFTSFAQQMHQMFVSYGVFMGVGIGLTRETSNLMIGQYFKRRRDFIEILVQAGSGIGTALFSVFYREIISSIGWRFGLQAITAVFISAFVLGIFYRSASLYHPQRRAILHLKSQKKKIKDKNRGVEDRKPPYFDFTTIKTRTLQIIMLSTGTAALGIYSPIYYLALHCKQEGLEDSSIVLIQTFIGFAFAIGNMGFGMVVVRRNDQCHIARQYLCQASLFGLGVSILALGTIHGYHSYVLFAWIYGLFLGGYHFSLKVYTFERMRARHFARAWGFVQWSKSLPVLFGVPITGYINNMQQGQTTKSGFYFACTFTFVGASFLFLMNLHQQRHHKKDQTVRFNPNDSRMSPMYAGHRLPSYEDGLSVCCCEETLPLGVGGGGGGVAVNVHHRNPSLAQLQQQSSRSMSLATSVDVLDPKHSGDYLACISEEGLQDYYVGGECITSCDKVENYLLFSEFERNLSNDGHVLPTIDGQCVHSICKHGNVLVVDCVGGSYDTPAVRQPEVVCQTEEEEEEESDDDDDEEQEGSDLVAPLPRVPETPRAQKVAIVAKRPVGHPRPHKSVTVIEEMTTSV